MSNIPLLITLRCIAVVQAILGFAFLFAPEISIRSLGLAPAPAWTNWLFGMMAARFLGFAYGMWIAAQLSQSDRLASTTWIKAMIGIQAIDWAVTLLYLWRGDVLLSQVTTAAFLPVVFIVILLRWMPTKWLSVHGTVD